MAKSSPKRFLIVRLSAIGDVILSLPFATWIKQRYPEAEVHWAIEKSTAPLVAAHPHVDRAVVVDTKGWRQRGKSMKEFRHFCREFRSERYDQVIDLQGNIKSGLITALARGGRKIGFTFLSAAEWPSSLVVDQRISIQKSLPIRTQLAQFFEKSFGCTPSQNGEILLRTPDEPQIEGEAPHFMICPGSNWVNKQLTEESWIAFLERVKQSYQPTFHFIWGAEREERFARHLQSLFPGSSIYGRLDFGFWQALMRRMDLVVTMDSASLHLCATTETPSFAFFGPSRAAIYNPEEHKRGFFQGHCPYGLTFEKRCPKLRTCQTGACLRAIDGEALFDSFQEWASNALISRSKSM